MTRKAASFVRMKASSSSTYRKVEQLLFWAGKVVDRTPKTPYFGVLGSRVTAALLESLTLIDLAQRTRPVPQFMEVMQALCVKLQEAKTIFRVYRERSMNAGERTIAETGTPEPPGARILTRKQYAEFITQMYDISAEINRWAERITGGADKTSPDSTND